MSIEVSPCIGLTAPDPGEASRYYQDVFRMKLVGIRDGVELLANGLRFFIDPGPVRPPVLELMTDELTVCRGILKSVGFEEIVWKGPGKANIFVDPFGFRWNLYEQDDFESDPPENATPDCPVLNKIGLQTPYPIKAADFYANLLGQAHSSSHDSWFVDARFLRLRLEDLLPPGPAFFVDPGFDLSAVDEDTPPAAETAVDPYGIRWRPGPVSISDSAVVQTKQTT